MTHGFAKKNNFSSIHVDNLCKYYSGEVTIVGGAGDVTVNLPFDWTGGFLRIVVSNSTSDWMNQAGTPSKVHAHEASYEGLTNPSYTNTQISTEYENGTIYTFTFGGYRKVEHEHGIPKSATPTSFTLNNKGTTVYIKYFVWAPYTATIQMDGGNLILLGEGSPISIPQFVGQTYIDTTNGSIYTAVGTSGPYNWGFVGRGNLVNDYLTGITSWYDASDSLIPQVNGATLTGWNDKGSLLNHLTSVTGTPNYIENVQNGLPAAYFDGNEAISGADKTNSSQPYTSFLVFKPTIWGADNFIRIVEMKPSVFFIGKTSGNTRCRADSGTTFFGDSLSKDTPYLITTLFNGTNSLIKVNESDAVVGNAGTNVNTNYPIIGMAHDGTDGYTGYVMEWRIYDGAMSEANQEIVRASLNAKWGVY